MENMSGGGLRVECVHVSTGGGRIVTGVSLSVDSGELHVMLGPNGAGKSSLANGIMGHRDYRLEGKLLLDGEDITALPTHERVRRGLVMAIQNPPSVEGVRVGELLSRAIKVRHDPSEREVMTTVKGEIEAVGLPPSIIGRELMVGMSGGERKRLELARVLLMKPKVAILDEPDSGIDLDGLPAVADAISRLIESGAGVILITHQPVILRYLKPNMIHVMVRGALVAGGGPELVEFVERKGYRSFAVEVKGC